MLVEALAEARCECVIKEPASPDRWALLEITVDESTIGNDAFEVCRRLRAGTPPIYVGHGKLADGVLVVNPLCLDEAQAGQLATRLAEEFG